MIYVLVLFLSVVISGCLISDNYLISIISIGFILATFAALRGPDVASDFAVYESWYFNPSEENGLLERSGLFEVIYFQLSNLFMQAGLPFRMLVWTLAFFAVSSKTLVLFYFSKSVNAFVVSLLIYVYSFYLLHDFMQIRAGMAIAMLFFAFLQLVNDRPWRFVALVLVATGFHSSALIILLLLLPYRGRLGKLLHAALLISIAILIFLTLYNVSIVSALVQALIPFDPRLELYLSMIENSDAIKINPLSLMVIFPLALVLSLSNICLNFGDSRTLFDERDNRVIVLVCRSILAGLIFLVSFWEFQTVAMRLYELHLSLIPILAAIVFSKREWLIQKVLLLMWVAGAAYFTFLRDDAPVHTYEWLFS